MPQKCSIKSCGYSHTKDKKEFNFFKIPVDDVTSKQWLEIIGVENINYRKDLMICSKHFTEDCLERSAFRTILKSGAYPTLFLNNTESCLPSTPKRRVIKTKRRLFPTECLDNCCYRQKYIDTAKQLLEANKTIKLLRRQVRNKSKTVRDLKTLCNDLKNKNLIERNTSNMLNSLDDQTKEIVNVWLKEKRPRSYNAEIRSFALTLNFLSPKAYSFVRTIFKHLPAASTISRWYSSINGEPGICQEALVTLKNEADSGNPPIIALMFDEMSIRKFIEFDGQKNRGFVDYGLPVSDHDNLNVASQALVFMAVSLRSSWKIPVGYYFIDSLSGEEKAEILLKVVNALTQAGVSITSVVCDGCSANLSMAKILGVDLHNFTSTKLQIENNNIFFILDNCHAVKLMRNALFQYKVFYDKEGEKIDVQYIYELQKLQEKEQLSLANRLSKKHINYQQQIMKVRLAVQTLSSSVADALDFCRENLKLPQFQGSEGTVNFIRLVDRLFDIFNSRNIYGKGYKTPLKKENSHVWGPFLKQAFDYLLHIKLADQTSVLHSKRKTPFIAFLLLIRSTESIFTEFVGTTNAPLKYLLMYKHSQDHLELFFSAVRSKGGFNNNPSCRQFVNAFRRLLIHHQLKHNNANCLAQDKTNILSVSSSTQLSLTRRETIFEEDEPIDTDLPGNLSLYVDNVVEYIGGYIVRKLIRILKCDRCSNLIVSNSISDTTLIGFKNRGGLQTPSKDVIVICKQTERYIRNNRVLPQQNSIASIENFVLRNTILNIFQNDDPDHSFMTAWEEESHLIQLCKKIIRHYYTIRLHYINKNFNIGLMGNSCRQRLTKTILFRHQ